MECLVPEAVQPYLTGFEAEQRRRDMSQFFTPRWLAERAYHWAVSPPVHLPIAQPGFVDVLEPSAGRGALIDAALSHPTMPATSVLAYEVDPAHVEYLTTKYAGDNRVELRTEDFLRAQIPRRRFAFSNPPYEDGQDTAFALRALRACHRGVFILGAAVDFGAARRDSFWRHVKPLRKVHLSGRPQFGGEHSPQTNFVIYDLALRHTPLQPGEEARDTVEVTWW